MMPQQTKWPFFAGLNYEPSQRPSLSLKQERLWFIKDGPFQALIALFDKRHYTITEDNVCAVIGQYLLIIKPVNHMENAVII